MGEVNQDTILQHQRKRRRHKIKLAVGSFVVILVAIILIATYAILSKNYYNEYKEILLETISNSNISIVYNVNVGHAQPRCIIPFGVNAIVNMYEQCIKFEF